MARAPPSPIAPEALAGGSRPDRPPGRFGKVAGPRRGAGPMTVADAPGAAADPSPPRTGRRRAFRRDRTGRRWVPGGRRARGHRWRSAAGGRAAHGRGRDRMAARRAGRDRRAPGRRVGESGSEAATAPGPAPRSARRPSQAGSARRARRRPSPRTGGPTLARPGRRGGSGPPAARSAPSRSARSSGCRTRPDRGPAPPRAARRSGWSRPSGSASRRRSRARRGSTRSPAASAGGPARGRSGGPSAPCPARRRRARSSGRRRRSRPA